MNQNKDFLLANLAYRNNIEFLGLGHGDASCVIIYTENQIEKISDILSFLRFNEEDIYLLPYKDTPVIDECIGIIKPVIVASTDATFNSKLKLKIGKVTKHDKYGKILALEDPCAIIDKNEAKRNWLQLSKLIAEGKLC